MQTLSSLILVMEIGWAPSPHTAFFFNFENKAKKWIETVGKNDGRYWSMLDVISIDNSICSRHCYGYLQFTNINTRLVQNYRCINPL